MRIVITTRAQRNDQVFTDEPLGSRDQYFHRLLSPVSKSRLFVPFPSRIALACVIRLFIAVCAVG